MRRPTCRHQATLLLTKTVVGVWGDFAGQVIRTAAHLAGNTIRAYARTWTDWTCHDKGCPR